MLTLKSKPLLPAIHLTLEKVQKLGLCMVHLFTVCLYKKTPINIDCLERILKNQTLLTDIFFTTVGLLNWVQLV